MKLDTRQKILIPLIIIAFIYVGWQIYHIFLVSTPDQALPHPMAIAQASSKQMTIQPTTQVEQNQSAIPNPEKIAVPERKTIEKLSLKAATGQSAAYLHLVKQYRELEAKRMLLEEKMAIAETEQKIAELNAKLVKFGDTEANTSIGKERAYKLIYLDHQNGQWSATLSDNSIFREVKVGTKLSDGSRAIAINSKGVILVKDGKTELLTFSGAIPLSNTKVRMISPVRRIIEPVHAKVVVQKIEKHKISEPKSVAPKRIIKSIEQVQLTKNPIPKKTTVKLNNKVKPVPLIANYSVRPVNKTSLQKPLKTTKNNNVTVVELAPEQTIPKSLITNYSVKPVQIISPKKQLKPAKNKNITIVKHAAKQLKPKPIVANYSVRPVKKSIPLQTPSERKKNNSVTVVQLSPKRLKPKSPIANYSVKSVKSTPPEQQSTAAKSKKITVIKHAPNKVKPKLPVANYSVRPVKKSIPLQIPSKIEKNNNVTVVQLAPKQIKSVKSKTRIAKPIDLTYKEKITPPAQPKSSKVKTVSHTKITQLIPTPAKSNNKVAKVTKKIVKKPSVHKKKRIRANRENQPIVFSPLPAKNNTEQDNNSPIILMN